MMEESSIGRGRGNVDYHLCWFQWARKAALIVGGAGCWKSDEKGVTEARSVVALPVVS